MKITKDDLRGYPELSELLNSANSVDFDPVKLHKSIYATRQRAENNSQQRRVVGFLDMFAKWSNYLLPQPDGQGSNLSSMTDLISSATWAESLKSTYQLPAHVIEPEDPDEVQGRTEFSPLEIIAAMNLTNSSSIIIYLYRHYYGIRHTKPFSWLLDVSDPESTQPLDQILLHVALLQTKYLTEAHCVVLASVIKNNITAVLVQAAKYNNFKFLARRRDIYNVEHLPQQNINHLLQIPDVFENFYPQFQHDALNDFFLYQLEQLRLISATNAENVSETKGKLYYHMLFALLNEYIASSLDMTLRQEFIKLVLCVPACKAIILDDLLKKYDANAPMYQTCTQKINEYTAVLLDDVDILNGIQIKSAEVESKADTDFFLTSLPAYIGNKLQEYMHYNSNYPPEDRKFIVANILDTMSKKQLSETQLKDVSKIKHALIVNIYWVVIKYAVKHLRWDVVERIGSNGFASICGGAAAATALNEGQFALAQRLIQSFLQTYSPEQKLHAVHLMKTLLPHLNKIQNISLDMIKNLMELYNENKQGVEVSPRDIWEDLTTIMNPLNAIVYRTLDVPSWKEGQGQALLELAEKQKHALCQIILNVIVRKEISVDIPLGSSNILGQGGMGVVYSGFLKHTPVAIKKQHNPSKELNKKTKNEINLHRKLSHPNIVALLGYYADPNNYYYCIVLELMTHGSLSTVLRDKTINLPWLMRLSIAMNITNGLAYLHEQHILHRDIKSKNVLLNDKMQAKISDFGGAVAINSRESNLTRAGTPNYLAPELIENHISTKKSDIYALGILFGELASRESPFKSAKGSLKVMFKLILAGKHEDIPKETPNEFAALITDCRAQKANQRPSANLALEKISRIEKSFFFSIRKQLPQTCTLIKNKNAAVEMVGCGLKLFSGSDCFWTNSNDDNLRSNVMPHYVDNVLRK